MTDSQSECPPNQDGKTSVFKRRECVPVETSQGIFFARHITVGDMKSVSEYFDEKKDKGNSDLNAFGKRLLKLLVCTDSENDQTLAITNGVPKTIQ